MIKRLTLIGALCVVIFITGCIDTTTVISLRKDGIGTITEIVYMDESVISMFKGMTAQMGDETEAEQEEPSEILDIEKYKAKADKLGAGVKFVSAKEVTNQKGSTGVEVIYSFDDIEKLNIQAKPENPVGDQMAGMMEAESVEEEENPITFEFIKGSTPKLVVNMPKKEEPEPAEETQPEETASDPEAAAQGMAMMRLFLAGFRIRMTINLLEGTIQKTNASFVERTGGKDTVTLLDVALGEIMSNEKYAKEWERMSQTKDMSTAMETMKNIPGLKIEPSDRIEISFK